MDKTVLWKVEDEVVKHVNCQRNVAKNVVSLLEKGNTVPFIARYRQDQTECMGPEMIREIKDKVEELKEAEGMALKAVKFLEKSGKKDPLFEKSILEITDITLLKELLSSLKPEGRTSKLKAALKLEGLEEAANQVLNSRPLSLESLVRKGITGLSTYKEMLDNLSLVLADMISKQKDVLNFVLNKCREAHRAFVISKKVNSKKLAENTDVEKFKEYFDLKIPLSTIKPHKYLAMKRGENLNVLKTSIELQASVEKEFLKTFEETFVRSSLDNFKPVVAMALKLAFEKMVAPQILTKLRNDLKKTCEDASIKAFCLNLRQLLMVSPLRRKHILGVDPGFKHGCKFALIGPTGEVLDTGVVYLSHEVVTTPSSELDKLRKVLSRHRCEVVAIGNGVGCRKAEEFFSYHNKIGSFKPLRITFSIILENGASVYSASELAKKELPDLEITLRGAVSIARRLQDPLMEMIKIDPKNLGVGMYQHDVSEKKLKNSLDGVVEDCVSNVGVDVNVCNDLILQHIAGLGPVLAKNIISKRDELGGFRSRRQLLKVKGLGENKFMQCAGFLRINNDNNGHQEFKTETETDTRKRKLQSGKDSKSKKRKKNDDDDDDDDNDDVNQFDKTTVHPESYELASRLLMKLGLLKRNIGSSSFANAVSEFVNKTDISSLSKELNTSTDVLHQIIESLRVTYDYDVREGLNRPIFRSSVTEMKDIRVGDELMGQVTNVTSFGAFVDIGVEKAGLIHSIPFHESCLCLGMQVVVTVTNVEPSRGRIGLRYVRRR